MIRLSLRSLRIGIAALVLLLLMVAALLPGPRSLIGRVFDPAPVAAPAALSIQRGAAERGIQRGYKKATDQLDAVRKLKVQATPQQIDSRIAKALDDLRALRQNALIAVGGAIGADDTVAARYAAEAAQRLDAAGEPGPDALLAPRLATIVQRMDELASQIADQATRDLTVPGGPTASPAGSPRPSPTPTR